MAVYRGSAWGKWDLHVHTPASIVNGYGGEGHWDKFLRDIEALPPEFKVIGVNDYLFLDGYRRILQEREKGRLKNIDLFLPVIELRLDKFGGSQSSLSRVNFHVIFSNDLSPDVIESQFLMALRPSYTLNPQYDVKKTHWSGVPTPASLADLGTRIIESVPEAERTKFKSPIVEGFNNLCVGLDKVLDVLNSHYFRSKAVTAVGKTEWADIKWNDQSIADKKSIINCADFVFTSASTPDAFAKSRMSLSNGGVNARLLDCSDAHNFSDSTEKDRIGKCFTWIKADPTFEGLRQAVFSYDTRVNVSANPPIEPPLQIHSVKIDFPASSALRSGEREEVFCYRGRHEIHFSPFLTCIVGGRGTGKSTMLQLIHEKLEPSGTKFFKENQIIGEADSSVGQCVTIEGISESKVVEFLQQNEVEHFASDHARLTAAIFARLRKLDKEATLSFHEQMLAAASEDLSVQEERVLKQHRLTVQLSDAKAEMATQAILVESIKSEPYQVLNNRISQLTRELQGLVGEKSRLDDLLDDIGEVLKNHAVGPQAPGATTNPYEVLSRQLLTDLSDSTKKIKESPRLKEAKAREEALIKDVAEVRAGINAFLTERGLTAENLSDVSKASERRAELEQTCSSVERELNATSAEIASFQPEKNLVTEYIATVTSLLEPINDNLSGLGDEVRPIRLKFAFNEASFRESLVDYLVNEMTSSGLRADYIAAELAKLPLNALGSLDDTLALIRENATTAKAIREYLVEKPFYEQFKLRAEQELLNVARHGQIHVSYDNKPVEQSSFGQRCTAAIVVLLVLGNTPIIIDEPEAHLDSSLIANYLVGLIKRKKSHRQIVFATHNANFVINADAELIHCLGMGDGKLTTVSSTSIENTTYRDRLLALEGGKEAFLQRERRYDIA